MMRSDETALSFFRRRLLPKVYFQKLERVDSVEYGQCLEVQVEPRDIAEAVLSLISYFLMSAPNGRVYHLSTGDNLYYSLQQSGLDLTGSSVMQASSDGRLLASCVYSCQQLAEFFKLIASSDKKASIGEAGSSSSSMGNRGGNSGSGSGDVSVDGRVGKNHKQASYEPTLVILESLSPVLIAEKTLDGGRLPAHSPARSMFKAQTELLLSQNVIVIWVTALCRRHEGALRDASRHDELSTLWRQQIPHFTVWRGAGGSAPV